MQRMSLKNPALGGVNEYFVVAIDPQTKYSLAPLRWRLASAALGRLINERSFTLDSPTSPCNGCV